VGRMKPCEMLALGLTKMNPVLPPRCSTTVAETLELSETELGRLFGVSRQAVGQWRERGVPSNRMAKLGLSQRSAICCSTGSSRSGSRGSPGGRAGAYGGLSMLEMIERDRQDELQAEIRRSFDWAATA